MPQRARDDGVGALGDLERIVLDPAGLSHDLLVLELMARDLVAAFVEHHEPRAGRSLIDGADESRHGDSEIQVQGFRVPGFQRFKGSRVQGFQGFKVDWSKTLEATR